MDWNSKNWWGPRKVGQGRKIIGGNVEKHGNWNQIGRTSIHTFEICDKKLMWDNLTKQMQWISEKNDSEK